MEKIVEPGTPLAYSEELLPGAGTYDDGEQIRAAVYGTQNVDPATMEVRVTSAGHTVATIEKGDIVLGLVTYVKPELASVKILSVRGKRGSVLQNVDGTLHVSKLDNRYVSDLGKEIKNGDILRAKVIGMRGGPQLVTDRPELGVIQATSADGNPLVLAGDRLKDLETGRTETRKLASDYGSGVE